MSSSQETNFIYNILGVVALLLPSETLHIVLTSDRDYMLLYIVLG